MNKRKPQKQGLTGLVFDYKVALHLKSKCLSADQKSFFFFCRLLACLLSCSGRKPDRRLSRRRRRLCNADRGLSPPKPLAAHARKRGKPRLVMRLVHFMSSWFEGHDVRHDRRASSIFSSANCVVSCTLEKLKGQVERALRSIMRRPATRGSTCTRHGAITCGHTIRTSRSTRSLCSTRLRFWPDLAMTSGGNPRRQSKFATGSQPLTKPAVGRSSTL